MGFLDYERKRHVQGLRSPFTVTNPTWQRLAESLGGQFIGGSLRTLTFRKLLVPLGPWTVVIMEADSVDAGHSQFGARALYQRRNDFHFIADVHPTPFSGAFQRFLAKPLFKRNLIRLGDKPFDDSSFLQCDCPALARRFFSEPIRTALLRLAPGRLEIRLGKRSNHMADIAFFWFRDGPWVEDLSAVPAVIDLIRLGLSALVEIGSCENVAPEFVEWPYLPQQ